VIAGDSVDWSKIAMQLVGARQQQQQADQRMQHISMLSKLMSSALVANPMKIAKRQKKEQQGMMNMGKQQQQPTRGDTGGISLSDTVRSGGGGGFGGGGGGGGWGAMGM
jgi:uncharacterized membrane protein YgcG